MTTEYWSVSGTSLDTHAYRIESWGGTRLSPPPVRGENITIPYRPGSEFTPKTIGERIITLGMWVRGVNTDGTVPTDQDEQFNENWDALIRLLYRPWEQYTLTKRWKMNGGLMTATALASYHGGMDPEMWSRTGATFGVDLMLADPYFYGTEVADPVAAGATETVNHAGHAPSAKLTVELNGPLTNPTLSNDTHDISFTYDGVIATGEVLSVNVANFRHALDGSLTPWNISKAGSVFPFELYPGDNEITLTADSGAGTADIIRQPNYI